MLYSVEMAGFDSYGVFAAEDLSAMYELPEFQQFEDDMKDYVDGWVTEEDYEENEDANAISAIVTEITKEEYDEDMEFYTSKIPYNVG